MAITPIDTAISKESFGTLDKSFTNEKTFEKSNSLSDREINVDETF